MKIAIYTRVSTSNQRDNTSLDFQENFGIKFCQDMGYEYEVFSEAKSGDSLNRNEFNKLQNLIKDGLIDAIWVYDNDRLTRSIKGGGEVLELLIKHKAKLFVGYEEKVIDSVGGRFEYNIRSVVSSFERERIRDRMNFGKISLVENGGKLGNVGLGFKRVGKKLEIDEEGARLIRDIYKIYNYKDVSTFGQVFMRINRKNEKDGSKYAFSASSIGRVLKDKKYNGVYEGSVRIIDEVKSYNIQLDKIIDDDLFNRTQEKIKKIKGKNRGNIKNHYELKGKVLCGDCGEVMWVVKNYEYTYYSCSSKSKNVKEDRKNSKLRFLCKSKERKNNKISIKSLESIIWKGLFKVLENSEDYHKEYRNRYEMDKGGKDRFSGRKMHLENKKEKIIKDYEIGLKELIKFGVDEVNVKSLKSDYDKDIMEIEEQIQSIELEISKSNKLDEVSGYLELLKNDLKNDFNIMRFQDKKRFIDKYICSIKLRRIDTNTKQLSYQIDLDMHLKDVGGFKDNDLELIDNKNSYILKFKSLKIQFLIHKKINFKILIAVNVNNKMKIELA